MRFILVTKKSFHANPLNSFHQDVRNNIKCDRSLVADRLYFYTWYVFCCNDLAEARPMYRIECCFDPLRMEINEEIRWQCCQDSMIEMVAYIYIYVHASTTVGLA